MGLCGAKPSPWRAQFIPSNRCRTSLRVNLSVPFTTRLICHRGHTASYCPGHHRTKALFKQGEESDPRVRRQA